MRPGVPQDPTCRRGRFDKAAGADTGPGTAPAEGGRRIAAAGAEHRNAAAEADSTLEGVVGGREEAAGAREEDIRETAAGIPEEGSQARAVDVHAADIRGKAVRILARAAGTPANGLGVA